jgi:hypothetical protein
MLALSHLGARTYQVSYEVMNVVAAAATDSQRLRGSICSR